MVGHKKKQGKDESARHPENQRFPQVGQRIIYEAAAGRILTEYVG
jgi:hypothetical protein